MDPGISQNQTYSPSGPSRHGRYVLVISDPAFQLRMLYSRGMHSHSRWQYGSKCDWHSRSVLLRTPSSPQELTPSSGHHTASLHAVGPTLNRRPQPLHQPTSNYPSKHVPSASSVTPCMPHTPTLHTLRPLSGVTLPVDDATARRRRNQ